MKSVVSPIKDFGLLGGWLRAIIDLLIFIREVTRGIKVEMRETRQEAVVIN